MSRLSWLTLAVMLAMTGLAAADEPGQASTGADAQATAPEFGDDLTLAISPADMLLRVGLGLVLVFGILGAVLFLYRKATRGAVSAGSSAAIEVLSQRGLGQRASLAVVRVAGQTLLVGVTPQQLSTLAQIGEAPAPPRAGAAPADDALAVDALLEETAGQSFEGTLAGEIKRVRENMWASLKRVAE